MNNSVKGLFSWLKDKLTKNKAAPDYDSIIRSKIESLEELLGYTVSSEEYFVKALTHRSYLEITPEIDSGAIDSAVGAAICALLIQSVGNSQEDKNDNIINAARIIKVETKKEKDIFTPSVFLANHLAIYGSKRKKTIKIMIPMIQPVKTSKRK